ncbi:hypothetical protein SAMD00019534_020400 [Acytostelium subglobosum LB1]|uniref:hypothetical protein n=1 Tax=Acytostelium subglobosum LB1 TaxID=1410327 RepID=UPI000644CCC4|nr:hypothetical protein SAMD00019534_020400 [Acytostelium subglobosum LB1]GAM18865.1 hypothetical protein SAMD00019534_020400 [Acytostelium subglobosum LB1]|eukprot:XP_012758085.1 hypothetical protein SAMD00019534_020400 [Acytostelium subglobosum LB1]
MSDAYYQPTSSSLASADSIYTPRILFQVTVSRDHSALPSQTISRVVTRLRAINPKEGPISINRSSNLASSNIYSRGQHELTDSQKDEYQILLLDEKDYLTQVAHAIHNDAQIVDKQNAITLKSKTYNADKKKATSNLKSYRGFQNYLCDSFEFQHNLTQCLLVLHPPHPTDIIESSSANQAAAN